MRKNDIRRCLRGPRKKSSAPPQSCVVTEDANGVSPFSAHLYLWTFVFSHFLKGHCTLVQLFQKQYSSAWHAASRFTPRRARPHGTGQAPPPHARRTPALACRLGRPICHETKKVVGDGVNRDSRRERGQRQLQNCTDGTRAAGRKLQRPSQVKAGR